VVDLLGKADDAGAGASGNMAPWFRFVRTGRLSEKTKQIKVLIFERK